MPILDRPPIGIDTNPSIAPITVVGVISSGSVTAKTAMPGWVLLLGGGGIVIGLATYGFKVMATIGKKITELTPSRGFAAELGAAATVVLASGTGLPILFFFVLKGIFS